MEKRLAIPYPEHLPQTTGYYCGPASCQTALQVVLDGTVFDSSYRNGQPVIFVLGKLIPGWIEGIQLMRPGDEYLL